MIFYKANVFIRKQILSKNRNCSHPNGSNSVGEFQFTSNLKQMLQKYTSTQSVAHTKARIHIWQFMSHLYGILFTEYVFECRCLSYHYDRIPPYFVKLDNDDDDNNNDNNNNDDNNNNGNDDDDDNKNNNNNNEIIIIITTTTLTMTIMKIIIIKNGSIPCQSLY